MIKRSKKQAFDNDISIIDNISQHRVNHNSRQQKRYVFQQILKLIRALALMGLAYWGWITRDTIQDFIVHIFTNPKILP